MIVGALEEAILGRAFLVAAGLADGTVHVEDELGEIAVAMGLVDPLPEKIHQLVEVLFGADGIGLEAIHLTGRSGRLVLGPACRHRVASCFSY